jgi:hypothetical protein
VINSGWLADASSFRDPSGFVYYRDGTPFRRINKEHATHYNHLLQSGLYEQLVNAQWLVSHKEVDSHRFAGDGAYKTIQPERIPLISYPYEWCFSALKDAALLTLSIQKKALDFGMTLRDGSAYNIQFLRGRPIFIDTLSLGVHEKDKPWGAYKQFCQHFLAPLLLMSRRDLRLNHLCLTELDGIPLRLARTLLAHHGYLSWGAFLHILLHSRYEEYYGVRFVKTARYNGHFSDRAFRGLIESLENTINNLTLKQSGSEWSSYTAELESYSGASLEHKTQTVKNYLARCQPWELWDLGANTGVFSRMACHAGARVIALDKDPHCVEANYLQCKSQNLDVLPLVLNLANPTPAIGWQNQERSSLLQRASADTVLALALVHHLVIANNLPLSRLVDFFADICLWLIIEFIPRDDPKVQLLLNNRQDIFSHYTLQEFERTFSRQFTIEDRTAIVSSKRTLFLMRRRPSSR